MTVEIESDAIVRFVETEKQPDAVTKINNAIACGRFMLAQGQTVAQLRSELIQEMSFHGWTVTDLLEKSKRR